MRYVGGQRGRHVGPAGAGNRRAQRHVQGPQREQGSRHHARAPGARAIYRWPGGTGEIFARAVADQTAFLRRHLGLD